MAEFPEIKLREQRKIWSLTRSFVSKLHALFASLRQDKIFAVDIRGGGWAPSDHGYEIVWEMISLKHLDEFGVADFSDIPICWTDTGYYRQETKNFNPKGRMQRAVTNVCIYFWASNPEKCREMASRIVEVAATHGLKAHWGGNIDFAITLTLPR